MQGTGTLQIQCGGNAESRVDGRGLRASQLKAKTRKTLQEVDEGHTDSDTSNGSSASTATEQVWAYGSRGSRGNSPLSMLAVGRPGMAVGAICVNVNVKTSSATSAVAPATSADSKLIYLEGSGSVREGSGSVLKKDRHIRRRERGGSIEMEFDAAHDDCGWGIGCDLCPRLSGSSRQTSPSHFVDQMMHDIGPTHSRGGSSLKLAESEDNIFQLDLDS